MELVISDELIWTSHDTDDNDDDADDDDDDEDIDNEDIDADDEKKDGYDDDDSQHWDCNEKVVDNSTVWHRCWWWWQWESDSDDDPQQEGDGYNHPGVGCPAVEQDSVEQPLVSKNVGGGQWQSNTFCDFENKIL